MLAPVCSQVFSPAAVLLLFLVLLVVMADPPLRKGDTFLLDALQPDVGPYPVEVLSDAWRRGGMSVIYQGNVNVNGRPRLVALKTLAVQHCTETEREHLRREINSLTRARHQFVASLVGVAHRNGQFILASPLMANGNMLEYLRVNSSASRELLLQQVVHGLCYLHDCAGIVHGDLKCENVLISPSGDALLADFGLSTPVDKPAADADTHTAFRMLHTLRFAARELLFDIARSAGGRRRSKTAPSDVYAFGMLVVQAFTGQQPWPGFTDNAVVVSVYESTTATYPRPWLNGGSVLPNAWWALCVACWTNNPAMRPVASQIVTALAEMNRNQDSAVISNPDVHDVAMNARAGDPLEWAGGCMTPTAGPALHMACGESLSAESAKFAKRSQDIQGIAGVCAPSPLPLPSFLFCFFFFYLRCLTSHASVLLLA